MSTGKNQSRQVSGAKAQAKARVARKAAKTTGLRYVSQTMSGITRVRKRDTFIYIDARGKRITNAPTLSRIKALAIPPAYKDVWICPHSLGHLQAVGTDARGRKQYRYHARWRHVRDANKFTRMIAFGSALPRLRLRLKQDLASAGLSRDKVIALAISLLHETLIRVGNADYAKNNNSFGLTTLRDRHVQFLSQRRSKLTFRGKGGKAQQVELNNKRLTGILRRCQELPGQQLFQYVGEDGRHQPIDSGMVNDYLLQSMGMAADGTGFTAKDFRTWGATLLAARLLTEVQEIPSSATGVRRVTLEVCRQVADQLGNTPAICRKAYINPWVFAAWSGNIRPRFAKSLTSTRAQEQYALRLLKLQLRHERHV